MTPHTSSLFDGRSVFSGDYPATLVKPPPHRRLGDVADTRQLRLPAGPLNCAIKGGFFLHADRV